MLQFDIDEGELQSIVRELGATKDQVRKAWSRALQRTAGTLRSMASKQIRTDLGLRTAGAIRRRIKLRRGRGRDNMSNVRLWFGLNDMPALAFKGRLRQTSSGVEFRGTTFDQAFLARGRGASRRTMFRRRGSGRLPIHAVTVPVGDDMQRVIEDNLFSQLPDILMQHFMRDLRARVEHGVGA